MKTTAKPTPGPWTLTGVYDGGRTICMMRSHDRANNINGPENCPPTWAGETTQANAELILEAGTVYHETGLSPREILAQRDELLERLDTLTLVVGLTPISGNKEALQEAMNAARSAIQNASKGGEKG